MKKTQALDCLFLNIKKNSQILTFHENICTIINRRISLRKSSNLDQVSLQSSLVIISNYLVGDKKVIKTKFLTYVSFLKKIRVHNNIYCFYLSLSYLLSNHFHTKHYAENSLGVKHEYMSIQPPPSINLLYSI